MLNRNEVQKLIEILRKPEIIRKRNLGLSPDQTFLSRFIKRVYNQTETHKKMKKIIVSELIRTGFKLENILIEKKPLKEYGFRPDVTLLKDGKYVFFECHYHDGWCKDIPSHIYNNVEKIKNLGKIIICLIKKRYKREESIKYYIKNHKILSKVEEVWFLNLEKSDIERRFINN
jgi:hypothetical protein